MTVSAAFADTEELQVSKGKFNTYASGVERAYDITGKALMIKTPAGSTIVEIMVRGLYPNTTYGVHVHNKACNDTNGGGHYQHVVGGPVDAVNEIWPGFTTNETGIGVGFAKNDFVAGPDAVSIVIHDTDKARIACADLAAHQAKPKLKKKGLKNHRHGE
ncbi:MAG: hypothetical protein AB1810_02710 [Pseudomonadota bacterium]